VAVPHGFVHSGQQYTVWGSNGQRLLSCASLVMRGSEIGEKFLHGHSGHQACEQILEMLIESGLVSRIDLYRVALTCRPSSRLAYTLH
jgi:hypothetical protein